MSKGFSAVYVLVGILLVAAIAGGAYFLGRSGKVEPVKMVSQSQPTAQPVSALQASPSADETANWKTYTNNKMGFEIKHPDNYMVSEESDNKVLIAIDRLGSNGFWISNDKVNIFIDLNSLKTCAIVLKEIQENPGVRPFCLDIGKNFGQSQDIASIKLGNIDARSFYVTSTGQGGTFHIIQTVNNPKTQVYIFPSDNNTLVNQILSTFRFIP